MFRVLPQRKNGVKRGRKEDFIVLAFAVKRMLKMLYLSGHTSKLGEAIVNW